NLHIVPSSLDLLGIEMEIAQSADRTRRLRDALRFDSAVSERFSYVLVDCPPSLNLLTLNAMAAADSVLVPLQCEFFALEGLSQLLQTVDQVRSSINPELTIQGIVLTMFDGRNSLDRKSTRLNSSHVKISYAVFCLKKKKKKKRTYNTASIY